MTLASLARLVLLSAIWGGSFLITRICVPAVGPLPLIVARVGLAAVFLSVVGLVTGRRTAQRAHWRQFAVLGVLNSALPFVLFAFAAQTLSASLSSILNATSPIWGAIIAAGVSRSALPLRSVAGLVLGVVGVAVLVGFDASALRPGAGGAIVLALVAALCYGIATAVARATAGIDPFANALGSMWAATLVTVPTLPWAAPFAMPSPTVIVLVAVLGVVCSGMAYLLYFRLIADIGPAPALTVTFLVPVFGVLWGHVFLGEAVGAQTLLGGAAVVVGTALVTGFSPRALLGVRRADRVGGR